MNTTHTPGPWLMTEQGEDDLVVCAETGDFICCPSGQTFGQAIDNARLIAAAPELLAALQGMLEVTAGQAIYSFMAPQRADAQTALFKATGQTP